MDRRDFLAAWIQALLLAIFPFLRAQPAAKSLAIAEAYVERMAIYEYGWWINYAMWNMVRGYDMRWRMGQLTTVDATLLRSRFDLTAESSALEQT